MKQRRTQQNHSSNPHRKRRFCGRVVRLPWKSYTIREKSLKRFLARGKDPAPVEVLGLVNMGPASDEIWIERRLSREEKVLVTLHEMVHARRQMNGEDLSDEEMEEVIVELEAIARTEPSILGALSNGLALRVLHDFLTASGQDDPDTSYGLARIHDRIRLLVGGRKTMACSDGS